MIPVRELPSIEANIGGKKRKRVGLRDTLEKSAQGFSSWKQIELAVVRGRMAVRRTAVRGTCLRDSSQYSLAGAWCMYQGAAHESPF